MSKVTCYRATSESPAASLDEGEVRHGAAMGCGTAALDTSERAHAALNLAAYHALAGDPVGAMAAAGRAAVYSAEGEGPVAWQKRQESLAQVFNDGCRVFGNLCSDYESGTLSRLCFFSS